MEPTADMATDEGRGVMYFISDATLCRVPQGGYGVPEVWSDSDDAWHVYPQLDTWTNATLIDEAEAARIAGSSEALKLPRAEDEEKYEEIPEGVPPASM